MFAQDLDCILEGADVYARDGRWLGSVGAIHPATSFQESSSASPTRGAKRGGWLQVERGLAWHGKSLYVPRSAVACACPDWAMLAVDSTDLESAGWHKRPR
jgi:hypothetical protein